MKTHQPEQTRASIIDGIDRGERAIADGRTLGHAEAGRRLEERLVCRDPLLDSAPYRIKPED